MDDTFDFNEVVDSFEMMEQEDSPAPIEEAPDAFPSFNEEPEAMNIFEKIAKGEKGDKGDPGKNFKILGVVESVDDLPENPEAGDAWIVGLASNRNCYMFINDAWTNIGSITEGIDGVSPTVQTESITGGHRIIITDKNGDHPVDVMDGVSAPIYYGVCSSSANSYVKNVEIPNFVLETGVTVYVKFTYAGMSDLVYSVDLNVSDTGAKHVFVNGSSMSKQHAWDAGSVLSFTYDGTNWNMVDYNQNVFFGTCLTAANEQIKNVSITKSGSYVAVGTIIFVQFIYGNTAQNPKIAIRNGDARDVFKSRVPSISTAEYVPLDVDPALSWREGHIVAFCLSASGWVIVSNDEYATTSVGGLMSAADKTKLNSALVRADLLDLIYPVGSIYMSVNNVSPATLFGGTWERITGKFLLAASDTDGGAKTAQRPAEAEGGSADAIVPYHRHTAYSYVTDKAASGNAIPRLYGATYSSATGVQYTTYAGTEGNTKGANMPPYVAVYVWKRVQDTVEEGNE